MVGMELSGGWCWVGCGWCKLSVTLSMAGSSAMRTKRLPPCTCEPSLQHKGDHRLLGAQEITGCGKHRDITGCRKHMKITGCREHTMITGCRKHRETIGCKKHRDITGNKEHMEIMGNMEHRQITGCRERREITSYRGAQGYYEL